jgi:hypothetical protein
MAKKIFGSEKKNLPCRKKNFAMTFAEKSWQKKDLEG